MPYANTRTNPMQSNTFPMSFQASQSVDQSLPPVRPSECPLVLPSVTLGSLAQKAQNLKTLGPCRGYCVFHRISFQLTQAYLARTQGMLIKRSRLSGLDLPVFTTLVALCLLERLMLRCSSTARKSLSIVNRTIIMFMIV